jgi:TATA-binding protein-associated factor Taf7
MQPKRAREISNGGRKARSALVFVDDGEMTRGKKRKRPLEVDATAHSSEEEVEDDEEEEEEDQEEDIEMNEDSEYSLDLLATLGVVY